MISITDEAEISATLDAIEFQRTQLADDRLSPVQRALASEYVKRDIEWLRARILPARKPSGTYVAPVIRLVKR